VPVLRWFKKYDEEGNEINVDKLDPDHRELVTQPDVWTCEPYRFREIVRKKIDRYFHDQRQRERTLGQKEGPKPLVVLRADSSDIAFADNIGGTLRDLDCDWLRVPDPDVASLEDFAKEYAANGMLVIYRACPRKWILTRLQELRRFLTTESGRRWACALWRQPEDETHTVSLGVDGVFLIEPHRPECVREFVGRLRSHDLPA
jgi:hypothetical protein